MNRKQVIFLVIAVSLLAALTACSGEKKATPVAPETVSNLAIVAVQKTSAPDYIESTGTVRAAESAQLSSQVMAAVTAVAVREGDRVRKGQIVVTLDDSQYHAGTERAAAVVAAADKEVSVAEANYNLANATVKRYENLFSKKSVSPQEFDEVKARYQAAQAQLEQARAGQAQARAALSEARTMQGYTRLVAPFDGVVTEKRVELGNLAAP
jgi:multidrug efflux system membrane fusion protein